MKLSNIISIGLPTVLFILGVGMAGGVTLERTKGPGTTQVAALEERVVKTEAQVAVKDKQIAGLTSIVRATEQQLAVYEKAIKCLPVKIHVDHPDYGVLVGIGESELCGYRLAFAEKIYGPSMEAHIASLEEEIRGLRGIKQQELGK